MQLEIFNFFDLSFQFLWCSFMNVRICSWFQRFTTNNLRRHLRLCKPIVLIIKVQFNFDLQRSFDSIDFSDVGTHVVIADIRSTIVVAINCSSTIVVGLRTTSIWWRQVCDRSFSERKQTIGQTFVFVCSMIVGMNSARRNSPTPLTQQPSSSTTISSPPIMPLNSAPPSQPPPSSQQYDNSSSSSSASERNREAVVAMLTAAGVDPNKVPVSVVLL